MEILSFENRPTWNLSLNDNLFRGTLEIRYSIKTGKLWMIEEAPMESYLRGLAEGTNDQPMEYLKALVIAARTYAQYQVSNGGKHPDDNFDLDPSANDQVYRGYGFETRAPNAIKAVEETKGIMILYNNQVVVTPYFSHSDGRTRAWDEVWSGGPKAWLVSKVDPYCYGLTLSGHGVGLSGLGARMMAENGSTYDQILNYYYTGIEIKKVY
jgi:peptidoglycan hydrolase-like amidase